MDACDAASQKTGRRPATAADGLRKYSIAIMLEIPGTEVAVWTRLTYLTDYTRSTRVVYLRKACVGGLRDP